MNKKINRWMIIALLTALAAQSYPAAQASGANLRPEEAFSVTYLNSPTAVTQKTRATLPLSVHMVDRAIEVLSLGWTGMSPTQQVLFQHFFDPGQTGDIDEEFVQAALENYQQIRKEFTRGLVLVYETDSATCEGMGLYYTDFIQIHVCPYLLSETRTVRIARDLVHELAHKALFVWDRPYYYPHSSTYARLTPRGSWTADLPVVGWIGREIVRDDTLHHPDAYGHFAARLLFPESYPAAGLSTAGTNPEAEPTGAALSAAVQSADSKLLDLARAAGGSGE